MATIEVPHLVAADRGAPVRHDLPRALLVLLADDARPPLRRPRARDLRRRGAPVPRRLAAGLRASGAGDDAHDVGPASVKAARRGAQRRVRPARGIRGFSRRVEEVKWSLLELLIGLRREGKTGRRLRRAGQGQHAAQLLRHPHRPARVHRRPKSVQAGEASSRNAYSDLCSDRIDETRPDYILDPAVEPEEEIMDAAFTCPGMGGAADRADPAARGRCRGRS